MKKQVGVTPGARLVAAGSLLGIIGAVIAGRSLQSILFNVPAVHLATLVLTGVVVGGVTLLASVLPSRRAARTSPVEALSSD